MTAPVGNEHAQRAIAAAIGRRTPDPGVRERRNAYLAKQSDWKGECQSCKAALRGTIAEIEAHVCEGGEKAP